jgi:hypothetical protein
MYEVRLGRGDGWNADGTLQRTVLVRVRNVETLADAERLFRLFYLPFTGDCRSQATSGGWKTTAGVIVRSFSADVKPAIDKWPNLTYWPDGQLKTSVFVEIFQARS